jgi:hypothetical protein
MTSARITILLIAFIALSYACKKDGISNVTRFYGNWVNTNDPGDTLEFKNKIGKNILSYKLTQGTTAQKTEVEYKFSDGTLLIRSLTLTGSDFYPLSGFKWVKVGQEFEWNGNSRYPYLSSIQPAYTYRKLP